MNTIVFSVFGVLLFVSLSAESRRDIAPSSPDDRILQDLEFEMELEKAIRLSRARRVPSGDSRSCGKKLILFVFSVCGEACNPQTGKDIATACCSSQCSEEYIKSACCP